MSDRTRLVIVLSLSIGVASVVMLGLPLIYLTLPNPRVIAVSSIEEAGRGAYLVAGTRTLRLFPRSTPSEALPADAPTVASAESVVIVVRQADAPARYRLTTLTGEPAAAPVRVTRAGSLARVTLVASGLPDGAYEVTIPRESMFGGEDYVYFEVSR